MRQHQGPYEAAVLSPIASLRIDLPADVLADAEDAATAVARFDAELSGEIGPLRSVLLRSESAASSQIENLTASARAIAEAEVGVRARSNASLIVANTVAMDAAIALAGSLDADAILQMHRALLHHTHPELAGRWREEQVWIGGGDVGPHHAEFVPPHHSRVAVAIDDLVAFMGRDDLPVLVHAALAHAQFETIHPFPDGNGRTGRALMHAFLRNKGLTRTVTVPVSAGLLATTQTYFDALTAYRRGDIEPMIEEVSSAALRAVGSGRQLVSRLHDLRESWTTKVSARRDAMVWRVADLLVRYPVIDAPFVAERLGVPVTNIHRAIAPLEQAGVLTEFTDRHRNRAWRSTEVLEALDDFAAQSLRRPLT